jgi:hypothetical protein
VRDVSHESDEIIFSGRAGLRFLRILLRLSRDFGIQTSVLGEIEKLENKFQRPRTQMLLQGSTVSVERLSETVLVEAVPT